MKVRNMYYTFARIYSLYHSPTRQSTGVAAADEDPRSLDVRLNSVTSGHGKLHIVCKVFQVIYSLLDGVELQAADTEVAERCRVSVESVFEHDGRAVLLLRN